MPKCSYDRLTALDHSFLLLEKPNSYMHVASTQIYDVGPMRGPRGGIDAEGIKELTQACLHQIPRYRQKLAYVPVENHPVWVDDHNFNIDYHIRHTSLPRPGTEEQLKRLSARIMQQHLDRSRPAVGDVGGRRARGRPLRRDQQGPPLHDRRRVGRRPDEDPDERGRPNARSSRRTPEYIPRPAPSAPGPACATSCLRRARLPLPGGARRARTS